MLNEVSLVAFLVTATNERGLTSDVPVNHDGVRSEMTKSVGEGSRVNRSEFLRDVARRADTDVRLTTEVVNAALAEILEVVSRGDHLTITGFGKFYPQQHKGHRVQQVSESGKLASNGAVAHVDDYTVLKFSATRTVNRSLGAESPASQGRGSTNDSRHKPSLAARRK